MKKFLLLVSAVYSVAAIGDTIYAPEDASREIRFANPPASARILPIHHHRVNDTAKADEELSRLRADGFGGFAGNVDFENYLDSAESWKTFKYIVDRAHAEGMSVWLYDEKGYPSGTAGGKTLEGHPEWQARAYLVAEESLVGQVSFYGDFFKVLRALSAPSCDMLHSTPSHVTWLTPLLAGSAGELNGARYVMSEASDHCEKYRAKGDTRPTYQVSAREIVGALNRQIWGGVNTFTSYYRWQPFSRAARLAINEEIGRTITLMREGRSAADIALLYPADSLMVGFNPRLRGAGGIEALRTAALVNSTGSTLFTANRSFLIIDSQTIEAADVRDGMLVNGDLRWRTVVLAGVTTLSVEAVRKLEAFRKAGGLVIAVGDVPRNSCEAFPDCEVFEIAKNWVFLSDAKAPFLADFLAMRHASALRCSRGDADVLRTAHRRTKNGDVFLVMNDSGEAWSGAVRLRTDADVRVWNPRVGLSTLAKGDIPLDLPPFGAVVLTTVAYVDGTLVAGATQPFEPKAVK